LCSTIVGTPLQGPLHEGMRFVATHHTGVAMQLSTLWVAVSSAARSMLGCLLIKNFQVDVVGEMVAKFQEQEERCSHLETSGLRVYDLILGLADD
jgi:hypothetical protein